jgi:stage IV sporulation protein FB
MSWSFNIGSIAGTQVRVHITFLLFLGWIFAASWVSEGSQAAWSGLIFMVLLFTCVLAHEFGHIFTARAFGVATPDVTLLPIGGLARLERMPEKPHQEEFLIAIAGTAGQCRDLLRPAYRRRPSQHGRSRHVERAPGSRSLIASRR